MVKPKLLIVGAFPPNNSPIIGGIVTTCRILINSDFPNHFDMVLIDSTQISNPPPKIFIRMLSAMQRTLKYLMLLIREKPDAVLLFSTVGASMIEKGVMAWLGRINKRPVLLFPRGGGLIDEVKNRAWQRIWIVPLMKGATHILCQGPAWQLFAIKDLGYSEKSAPIIYNWSATNSLLKLGSEKVLYNSKAELNILFLGWLEKQKGIFELLEACRRLKGKTSFRLSLVGRGNAEEKAKNFVDMHNLGAHVTFNGWAHDQDKIKYLKSADVLVLPSWAEGFPNSVIEAMAAKVAVIVSSTGNVNSILKHRKHVMIVPPKDIDQLEMVIHELLYDSTLRICLAETGHEFAKEHFSADSGLKNLSKVIMSSIK